ncbi:MAG: DUF1772 domain-containing protein [Bryobacteraceae bacterium]|nr:DUF1772 domain-containing protein [Bryobacteraceae bacterium]
MRDTLFALELRATWFLTGLIWLIQLVHYPTFASIAPGGFLAFHAFHSSRIAWIVMPAMAIEASCCAANLYRHRTPAHALRAALLVAVWILTFFVMVPLHSRLDQSFDRAAIDQLILWNWPRTLAWTLRALLLSNSESQQ